MEKTVKNDGKRVDNLELNLFTDEGTFINQNGIEISYRRYFVLINGKVFLKPVGLADKVRLSDRLDEIWDRL